MPDEQPVTGRLAAVSAYAWPVLGGLLLWAYAITHRARLLLEFARGPAPDIEVD